MLLDTNIVIHACQPGGEWLSEWTDDPAAAIASVTRIEALGFPGISREEEEAIRGFLSDSICHALDDAVIERAIRLRQIRKMGAMDAIIAATALEYDLTLVTRNADDFKHVENLKLVNPFAAREQAG
ncbi:MAG: type II toxin-antitoxin system VapC family toxin [Verrucomicrobiae bacterium]